MKTIGPKAYIHLDRCISNFEIIQKKVGDCALLCVLKANAYGHGSIAIAKSISDHENVHFAVFSIGEAVELREANIENDIIAFSFCSQTKINIFIPKKIFII